jgi:tetratricopeptide (TPR) repeat protein
MFDVRKDLDTEKIYRRTRVERGWWPALEDLLGRREFRLQFVPRTAEIEPGKVLVFFERDAQLEVMRAEAERTPDDPRVHFDLAIQYRRQGLLDDAIASLRRAAELNPDHAGTLLNIAFLLYEALRHDEALAEFLSLRERFPREPSAQYGVAIALHHLGRYDEAIPEWEAFLTMDPRNTFAPKATEFLERARKAAGRSYAHDVP